MPKPDDSPPSTPPRQRYFDQMLASSLGPDYTSELKEENLSNISIESTSASNPSYFPLPSTVISNQLKTYDASTSINNTDFPDQPNFMNFDDSWMNKSVYTQVLKQGETNSCALNAFGRNKNKENCLPDCLSSKPSDIHLKETRVFSSMNGKLNKLAFYNPLLLRKCVNKSFKASNICCHRRYHSDSSVPFDAELNLGSLDLANDSLSSECVKKCNARCDCCSFNELLGKEIQSLKQINEKLWQHLCSAQNHVESLKRKSSPVDMAAQFSISGLLSSIHHSQKEKDNAIEERLKIALAERDSAVQELENIMCILSKGSGNQGNSGSTDNRIDKIKMLEDEIKSFKTCFDVWHLDNKHWESTLFDVLHQLVEKNNLAARSGNFLDGSNTVHKSSSTLMFEKSDEGKALKETIRLLNTSLNDEKGKREEAENNCHRLERLVHSLRIKLDGQNIGVPV